LFQTKLLKRIEDITNPRQNKMCPSWGSAMSVCIQFSADLKR
jgi:hypothetical protein